MLPHDASIMERHARQQSFLAKMISDARHSAILQKHEPGDATSATGEGRRLCPSGKSHAAFPGEVVRAVNASHAGIC